MSNPIGWCDQTWNPVTGCRPVSEGCSNCYAASMARRFWKDRAFGEVRCHPDRLDQPLHWRKPRRIFVCSMSDLMHRDVPQRFIHDVLRIVQRCSQHQFFILTKRPERFAEISWKRAAYNADFSTLPNLWLGVTAENQEQADKRIPLLLQTPAAHRFLSVEPLLGVVDLNTDNWLRRVCCRYGRGRADDGSDACNGPGCNGTRIDQVFVGPETGPKRRPCDPKWIRSIIDQCKAASVKCYVKAFPMSDCESCEAGDPCHACLPGNRISHDPAEWPEWARARELR